MQDCSDHATHGNNGHGKRATDHGRDNRDRCSHAPATERPESGAAVPDLTHTVDIRIVHLSDRAVCGPGGDWRLGAPNEEDLTLLDADELERRSRLRFANDRKLFTLAHILLRTELSRHGACAPADWMFVRGAHGKPVLAPDLMAAHGLHFSLSHAGTAAVCAISRIGPIGVDVEPLAGDVDAEAIAAIALAPDEQATLVGLEGRARQHRLLTFWTLKEAYAKARGTGLIQPMRDCSFSCGSPRQPPRLVRPAHELGRWQLDSREHSGYVVSVAVSAPAAMNVSFRYRCSRAPVTERE